MCVVVRVMKGFEMSKTGVNIRGCFACGYICWRGQKGGREWGRERRRWRRLVSIYVCASQTLQVSTSHTLKSPTQIHLSTPHSHNHNPQPPSPIPKLTKSTPPAYYSTNSPPPPYPPTPHPSHLS